MQGYAVQDDWKARIVHTRQTSDLRRGVVARTPLDQVFRRLVRTVIEPAFREVCGIAERRGVTALVEIELAGRQPRAMFAIRPSARSIRYELDVDGEGVRELEGVNQRSFGQRRVWANIDDLLGQLTPRYARRAATAILDDHLREAGLIPASGDI